MRVEDFLAAAKDVEIAGSAGLPARFDPGQPAAEADIAAAEARLGIRLPDSFKEFHRAAGDANIFGALMAPAGDLARLGEDQWELAGLIPFAQEPGGECYALKPLRGAEDELPVYKCVIATGGYAKVAGAFAEWLALHSEYVRGLADKSVRKDHPYFLAELALLETSDRCRREIQPSWIERKSAGAGKRRSKFAILAILMAALLLPILVLGVAWMLKHRGSS